MICLTVQAFNSLFEQATIKEYYKVNALFLAENKKNEQKLGALELFEKLIKYINELDEKRKQYFFSDCQKFILSLLDNPKKDLKSLYESFEVNLSNSANKTYPRDKMYTLSDLAIGGGVGALWGLTIVSFPLFLSLMWNPPLVAIVATIISVAAIGAFVNAISYASTHMRRHNEPAREKLVNLAYQLVQHEGAKNMREDLQGKEVALVSGAGMFSSQAKAPVAVPARLAGQAPCLT